MEDAMCYEERYFAEWTRKAARKREEAKPRAEDHKPAVQPERTAPKSAPPREIERELEPV
jgi:hypothetical protein